MKTVTEWKTDTLISWLSSLKRRDEDEQQRHRDRVLDCLLAPLAVMGTLVLIYFCTLPFPVEHWWIGLAGVVLLLPWLTRRFN